MIEFNQVKNNVFNVVSTSGVAAIYRLCQKNEGKLENNLPRNRNNILKN